MVATASLITDATVATAHNTVFCSQMDCFSLNIWGNLSFIMIGIWANYSGEYLYVIAVGTLLLFGLPLLLVPLKWARLLGWKLPEQTDLPVYFGRCLGAVICVLSYFAFKSAADPLVRPFFFQLILANFTLMVLVHIYGAVKKIQPISETIEIAYWLALFLVTLLFYPD
jgi:hypothetical protein